MGNKVRYFVLIAAILLIGIQFFRADYSNFFGWENLLSFIPLILIIIAMYGSILHVNKNKIK